MSVLLPCNLNPMLAMSVADLVAQAFVTLMVIGLYHVWITRQKKNGPPAPVTREQPPAHAPTAPIISNVTVKTPAPAATPAAVLVKQDSVPAEIAAVIAAAVAAVLDRPHRVVSVYHIGVPEPRFNVWAHEGRQHIFDSHKFR